MKRLGILISMVFWVAAANAGELRKETLGLRQGAGALCDYRFEGPIAQGDAAQFSAISGGSSGKTVCLNSSGGAFSDGLALFDVFWSKGLRAAVLAGESCEGACALVFLGGSQRGGTGNRWHVARELHIGATLGFHSPGFPVKAGRTYSAREVERGFAAVMAETQALHDIRQTSRNGQRAMTEFLYDRVLRTSGPSVFQIESVGKAGMADLQIFGVAYPKTFTQQNALAVCDLAYLRRQPAGRKAKSVDRMVRQLQADASRVLNGAASVTRVRQARRGGDPVTLVRGYPATAPRTEQLCEIDHGFEDILASGADIDAFRQTFDGGVFTVTFHDIPQVSRTAFAALDLQSLPTADVSDHVPYYAVYGANTLIKDLPGHMDTATSEKTVLPRLSFAAPQTVPRARFNRLDNIDLVGGDLTERGHRPVSLGACERICRETDRCRAYTWVRDKEWCFPKAGDTGRRINNGMVSGVRR